MKNKDHRDDPAIVVIRRKRTRHSAHHSGSWKIAYADFVTSMMAFFLVMWLVSATSEKTRKVISNYFNPINCIKNSFGDKGLNTEHYAIVANQKKTDDAEKSNLLADVGQKDGKFASSLYSYGELGVLARDPYKALDEILKEPSDPVTDVMHNKSNFVLLSGGSASLDSQAKQLLDDLLKGPVLKKPDNKDKSGDDANLANKAIIADSKMQKHEASAPLNGAADNAAEPQKATQAHIKEALKGPELQTVEKNSIKELDSKARKFYDDLQEQVKEIVSVKNYSGPDIDVSLVKEGIKLSLSDDNKFGMFNIGSYRPYKSTILLLDRLAKKLQQSQGKIIIKGYTDGRPYRTQVFDNWQLSLERARMVYYMLVKGGLDKNRLDHIAGFADNDLKNKDNPYASENRRIEIILRCDNTR